MTDKMRSFLKGLAMGLAGKPLEYAPEKEPVAYLCNGVQVPKFPEWDKEKYPYAAISYYPYDDGFGGVYSSVSLCISTLPMVVTKMVKEGSYSVLACKEQGYRGIATKNLLGTQFDAFSIIDDPMQATTNYVGGELYFVKAFKLHETDGSYLLWANHDIYTADTEELYLSASEPIPVYE